MHIHGNRKAIHHELVARTVRRKAKPTARVRKGKEVIIRNTKEGGQVHG